MRMQGMIQAAQHRAPITGGALLRMQTGPRSIVPGRMCLSFFCYSVRPMTRSHCTNRSVESHRRWCPDPSVVMVSAGSFAVWGLCYSTFDCSLMAIRGEDDMWNSIASGALTGWCDVRCRSYVKGIRTLSALFHRLRAFFFTMPSGRTPEFGQALAFCLRCSLFSVALLSLRSPPGRGS